MPQLSPSTLDTAHMDILRALGTGYWRMARDVSLVAGWGTKQCYTQLRSLECIGLVASRQCYHCRLWKITDGGLAALGVGPQ